MVSYIIDKCYTGFVVFWQSIKSFNRNSNSAVSASLAYHSLFALIPLLLLLFFGLSFFITSSQAVMNKLTLIISQFIPYHSDTILNEVYALARHNSIWGLVSIAMLLWAATPLVGTLRSAFFEIFKIEKKRSFFKGTSIDISVILLTLFMLVVVSLSHVTIKKVLVFGNSTVIYDISSYLFTAIIMTIFYAVFVPARVSFIHIAAGAVVTTFFWSIIRPLFGLFLSYNPQYGLAFGSLKALFIIIIWIYYSFSVLLFGTEIIANLRRKDVLLLRKLFYDASGNKSAAKLRKKFGRVYSSGDIIFREGEKGNEMFYVLSGSVKLTILTKSSATENKEQTLRIMKKDEYFGEMALLISTPRTTTAAADEDNTVVIAINPENFETLLREEPKIAMMLLKEFAYRLKKTNEFLG